MGKLKNKKVNIGKYWTVINQPFSILLLALLFGNFFLPRILTQVQIDYQEQIRQNNAKYEYSTALLQLSWKKLFLAKNYYWNYKEIKDFDNRKDNLWNEYYESVKEWNYKLVGNFFALEKYYGKDTKIYFENEVLSNQNRIHDELLKIREGEEPNTEEIERLFDVLDNRMYILAEKLFY